jgi:protoporphyrinogen IX oxidase
MNSSVAWALVFHVIGFVFWMAGLLVVTQVMAAHAEERSREAGSVLGRLEMKLLKGLAHPGALITIGAGTVLIVMQPGYLRQAWLHAKLSLVAILIGMNLFLHMRAREFHDERSQAKPRQFKVLHGVVSALFLFIVILVMTKPL